MQSTLLTVQPSLTRWVVFRGGAREGSLLAKAGQQVGALRDRDGLHVLDAGGQFDAVVHLESLFQRLACANNDGPLFRGGWPTLMWAASAGMC